MNVEQESVEITFIHSKSRAHDLDKPKLIGIKYSVSEDSDTLHSIWQEMDRAGINEKYSLQKIIRLSEAHDRYIYLLPAHLWACMFYIFQQANVKIISSITHSNQDPVDYLLALQYPMDTLSCADHIQTLAWKLVEWEYFLTKHYKSMKSQEEKNKILATPNSTNPSEMETLPINKIDQIFQELKKLQNWFARHKGALFLHENRKPREWDILEKSINSLR